MSWLSEIFNKSTPPEAEEKLNPAQPYYENKTNPSSEPVYAYERAYEDLEIVNRAINMVVDDSAEIPTKVLEKTKGDAVAKGVKKTTLETLLNVEPNPFQDISTFKRNLIIDLVVDGNIFIYYDGVHLYHLPASKMTIHASDTTYIKKFTFNGKVEYYPNEIIHIKDNSFFSIYRGTSRLRPALRTIKLLRNMRDFQDNFFNNGAVAGLTLESPNTLSDKIKERMIQGWQTRYNPKAGGRTPMILDGGLKIAKINDVNFRDLDFQNSIADNEKVLLKAIGVPPILLDSGNNANLRPNLRLYYLETILPVVTKINFGLERFFGWKLQEDVTHIPALQPEMSDLSNYYTSLVNGGVIAGDEARVALGMEPLGTPEMTEIRIPANIAGSAGNPSEGGRPTEETED